MNIQSQILIIKAFLKPKSGFLIIEILVSLSLCFVFILIMLKFEGEILSLYERFFVRNAALDLAVNTIEKSGKSGYAECLGRRLYLTAQTNQDFTGDSVKNGRVSNVVVSWKNCAGCDEKLTLGSA